MFISVLAPMLFGQSSLAQSNDENYILSQRNISPSKSIDEYQYYDGLGRLVEKVSVNLSPESGVDLLESTSYDAFGHVLQKGKPVALSGNLGNYTDVTRDHYISDYKEPYAYMEYFYENSPLGRKKEERGPGAAWIVHVVGSSKQEEVYTYRYDNADRLQQVLHQLNGGKAVSLKQNTYDKHCRLISQKVFEKETIGYGYNVREWPTDISSSNFRESLSYYDGKNREFGGNISAMVWSASDEILKRKYDFTYDRLSRLTSASYSEDNSTNAHYDTRYTYDLMGNMLTLKRNGLQDGGIYGLIDDVSFTYKENQLLNAEDKVEDPTYKDAWNFVDGASENVEYGYDKNGNMVKDLNKGILQITYNSLNLPTSLKMEGGKSICYVYDAQGKKLQASYVTTIPNSSMTLDYCDNMIYENGKLTQILVDGGYVSFVNGEPVYHYYLKDHLGSNRVAVNQATGEVEQVNHYYPFGGLMAESTGGSVQRYKYNGKELDRMHGLDWYDYGARWYDGMRFLTQDPHATDYVDMTPYAYCANNPINAIDTDGKRIKTILWEDDKSPKYYTSTPEFRAAMFRFAKTSFGKQLFADFTPKNSVFFGVKGNGKYSDFDVNINEMTFSEPDAKTAYFKAINAQTQLRKDENNKPAFDIIFDPDRSPEKLLETICHELAGHLYNYPEVLNDFIKTGDYNDARKKWNVSQDKDHQKMHDIKFQKVNIYQQVMMELFHKSTNLNEK